MMQILASSCSTDISLCCKDYALVVYLNVIQKILNLIHFVVPFILLVMMTIQFIKLMSGSADNEAKLKKGLLYQVFAAVIVFFIPLIINFIMGVLSSSFELSKCWQSARDMNMVVAKNTSKNKTTLSNGVAAKVFTSDVTYSEDDDQTIKKTNKNKKDKKASTKTKTTKKTNKKSTTSKTTTSKDTKLKTEEQKDKKRQQVVAEAKKYLGHKYRLGGESLTNGIDCSAFVQQMYAHLGYSIPRTSRSQAASPKLKSVKLTELKPGDLLFYTKGGRINHVTMYIGNNKVIHASNPRSGIIISPYSYRKPVSAKRVIS